MSRPMWFVKILKHYFPDRFAIADTTRKYAFSRKFIDWLIFEDDEIYYLPKDTLVKNYFHQAEVSETITPKSEVNIIDKQINKPDSTNVAAPDKVALSVREPIEKESSVVLPSDTVKYFIEKAKYIWIMHQCICRDSAQCNDYPIDLGCIFLGEPVLKINPQLGRLATKEEALVHLKRASDSGLVHMIGKNKLDSQWMGISPGNKLFTICNCCPCCCLYKVIPNLDRSISSKINKMPGVNIQVNSESCIGCRRCTNEDVCFIHSISLVNNKAVINELCVGCGRCVEICPTKAIRLTITDDSFVSKTVERLTRKVDVT